MRTFHQYAIAVLLLVSSMPARATDPAATPAPLVTPTPAPSIPEPTPPAPAPKPTPPSGISIKVDLSEQKAYLLLDGKMMYEAKICSGRPGHLTPTGDFTVLEKDQNHFSTLYGKMVDSGGKVTDWNADADMAVPKGGKFVAAPMEYFLRFDGANGLHMGIIKSFPSSHGCVRLPKDKAILFFNTAAVGTPVHIFGTPPKAPEPAPGAAKPAVTAAPAPAPTPQKKSLFPWIKSLHS